MNKLWIIHVVWVAATVAIACSSTARAQSAPDIGHRDFGDTTCYYTTSAATGDVTALSCVK